MLAGQLCTLIAFGLGGLAWFYTQRAFGFAVTWQQGMVIHLASNATKYLPGYAWQYISKAYLTKEKDTSTRRLSLAILSEVVLLFSSGIVVACITGGLAGGYWHFPWAGPRWAWPAGGVVAGVLTALWVVFLDCAGCQGSLDPSALAFGRLAGRCVRLDRVRRSLLAVCGCFCSDPGRRLRQCLVALAASAIVSWLVIFVPSGLGVREATLAALLAGLVPFSLGVVISIMVRLSVMLSELLGVLAVLGLSRHWPERLKYAYSFWGIRQNTPK